jgi:hypothetical protein
MASTGAFRLLQGLTAPEDGGHERERALTTEEAGTGYEHRRRLGPTTPEVEGQEQGREVGMRCVGEHLIRVGERIDLTQSQTSEASSQRGGAGELVD